MLPRETIIKLIRDKTVASTLKRRSRNKDAVRALQTILYELGFANELNWQKYGARDCTRSLIHSINLSPLPYKSRAISR